MEFGEVLIIHSEVVEKLKTLARQNRDTWETKVIIMVSPPGVGEIVLVRALTDELKCHTRVLPPTADVGR